MSIRQLAFEFNGEHQFWADLPNEFFPAEYRDIIEGHAYPFYEDVQPSTVLDLGANVGLYSLMCALVWPKAMIHAYEPEPHNFEMLRRNVGKHWNILPHQMAVGVGGGTAEFFIDERSPLCHGLNKRPDWSGKSIAVQVLAAKHLPKADLIKLDIEGQEPDILAQIDLKPVKWIYAEFHSETDRFALEQLLLEDFSLRHARISKADCGEVMYQRR